MVSDLPILFLWSGKSSQGGQEKSVMEIVMAVWRQMDEFVDVGKVEDIRLTQMSRNCLAVVVQLRGKLQ